MTETIRLATRGSDLALRQAQGVAERLSDRRREVDLVEVRTRGDRVRDDLIHRLGKTGAFVRALDQRVLDGEVDAAVHSMKDVPTEFPEDLVVAGVPHRGPADDVLVTPGGETLDGLPEGAVVGTSSLRRRAQVLARRPDIHVEPLRGNVDTRVEKLLAPHLQSELESDDVEAEIERRALEREVDTRYDAIVLAAAGLERSGLLEHLAHERPSPTEFVPAPGQGALAVTATSGSEVAELLGDRVDHPRTRTETTVERTILAELGGGCVAPMGVYAVLQGAYVNAVVRVLDREGETEVGRTRDLPVERHADAAREFARDLAEEGAADLIERARRRADEATEAKRE